MSAVVREIVKPTQEKGILKAPQTLASLVLKHDNDYSRFEPFQDSTPIATSIVIPVYNHAQLLNLQLSSWCQSSDCSRLKDWIEIVVVNDGSPGANEIIDIVEKHSVHSTIRLINCTSNNGAGIARNIGMKAAQGELVQFLDSDVVLPLGFIEAQWRIHNAIPNAVSVGLAQNVEQSEEFANQILEGRVQQPDVTSDFRFCNRSIYREGLLKSAEFLIQETDWFRSFGGDYQGWTLPHMVVGHNIAVRRKGVMDIGGFNPKFSEYGSEDTFLGAELIATGHYIVPLPDSGVFRIRHAPRHGNELQELRMNLRNTIRCHALMHEPYKKRGAASLFTLRP